MPLFEYSCEDCGVMFSRILGEMESHHDCPECYNPAELVLSEDISFSFDNELTHAGPVPQNTGVSSLDNDVDRVVGKDAEERWKVYDQRDALKRSILRSNPGKHSNDLSMLPDGRYRVMDPGEKKTKRNYRAFHNLAVKVNKKSRYEMLRDQINSCA